ncbi:YhfT family protein [Streptomyces inhibens]|uniref:YhfT family protein n=1 Tax=Streptomyces inhibens TaxID=2293571 RepID=UPI001EE73AD2|nr:YhfT family protein [Streptomyces inhibens]UKY52932.1 YhfT family protein [Streptomyces inhibens]
MGSLPGAGPQLATAAGGLDFSPAEQLTVIGLCALTAFLAHLALAVFNDGVRPFMLDFLQGRTTRGATTAVSFGLSAGFIFGLGAPMALSSGVLNPWLVFLPTDLLGLLAPKKWLAPVLGGAWGAVVVFGLKGADKVAHELPVDFLTAMQQMSTPILFLFTLFPVLAISKQFGRLRGALAGAVELVLVVLTMKLWPKVFAGALAMAVGVLLLIGFAVVRDLRQRRTDPATTRAEEAGAGGERAGAGSERAATGSERAATGGGRAELPADDPMASLFGASAARLRRHLPLFMVLGAGVCLLAQLHIFGGGEATSFLIAKGRTTEAAQVDFYRAFGFLPLIATTALASGAYGIAGFTFVYPIGYLLPSPWLALVCGALVLAVEVLALSGIGRVLGGLPSVRDSSEQLRAAIGATLQLAILFGSLMAANAMGGGLGILIVGGLYLLNEAMGRVVVRMAAGPAAVVVGGVLLNVLYGLDLFTPLTS